MNGDSLFLSMKSFRNPQEVYNPVKDIPLIKITRLNSIAQKRHSLKSNLANQIIELGRFEENQTDKKKRQTIRVSNELNNKLNSPQLRIAKEEITNWNVLDDRLSIKITDMLSKDESITEVFHNIAEKFNRKHSVSLKVSDLK